MTETKQKSLTERFYDLEKAVDSILVVLQAHYGNINELAQRSGQLQAAVETTYQQTQVNTEVIRAIMDLSKGKSKLTEENISNKMAENQAQLIKNSIQEGLAQGRLKVESQVLENSIVAVTSSEVLFATAPVSDLQKDGVNADIIGKTVDSTVMLNNQEAKIVGIYSLVKEEAVNEQKEISSAE